MNRDQRTEPTGLVAGGLRPMRQTGLYRRIPLLPHQMGGRTTPTRDLFVLIHLGIPDIDVATWRLRVGGMVSSPLSLDLNDLKAMPKEVIATVHQCAGNPLEPTVPTRRVANVEWGGVPLREIMMLAGVDPAAGHLWSFGLDHGEFAGAPCDGYGKDLPIERLLGARALIAYELNGAPLPAEHGFPARLVVPGYYGTNTVKWLDRIEFRDGRLDALFTTTYYSDPDEDGAVGRPVWEIPVGSIVTSPVPGSEHAAGSDLHIAGWAWAFSGVASVQVSIDGGDAWRTAVLERDQGPAWRRFTADVPLVGSGARCVIAKATATDGRSQPLAGVRYAAHTVDITVR